MSKPLHHVPVHDGLYERRKKPQSILRHKITRERKTKGIIAFDMESHGLGGEWAGGGYQCAGLDTVHFCLTPQDVIDAVFAEKHRSAIWYAHNGGEYDFKYLLAPLLARGKTSKDFRISVIVQGQSRVIGFKVHYRKSVYEFRDSYALMPASLRRLTEQLAPDYLKKEFDHEHELFDIEEPTHRTYLEYDVRGLLGVLLRFKALIREVFGVDVGWTAASTALRCWLATLPKGISYFRQPQEVRDFCRRAYFGGMVALRDTHWHEDVIGIDVNAMYPYVMLQGVPVGFACYTRQYETDRPGIYQVLVTVPDDNIYPMAPWRDSGYGVAWPTGTFETYMCSKELDDLLKYGCSFHVVEGWAFDRIEYPFKTFIETCERLELEHRGTALAMVMKIMRNSLYGKFGTRESGVEYVVSLEQPGEMLMPLVDERTGELIENLWTKPKTMDAAYLHPEWAAWVTASARIYNRAVAFDVGIRGWLYCDTDSNIFSAETAREAFASNRLTEGIRYGECKIDKAHVRFKALGPKAYVTIGLVDRFDTHICCKGIPQRALESDVSLAYFRQEGGLPCYSFQGMNGTLQVLKRGKPFSEEKQRSFPQLINSRHWIEQAGGAVRPIHLALDTRKSE